MLKCFESCRKKKKKVRFEEIEVKEKPPEVSQEHIKLRDEILKRTITNH